MQVSELLLEHLLTDQRLHPWDRSVYWWIVFCRPKSIRELGVRTGFSRDALMTACRRLGEARWLRLEEVVGRGSRSFRPVPLVPIECQLALAREFEQTYGMVRSRGEYLMKGFLNTWVSSRRFVDNARIVQLTNPRTGARLEYDRLYIDEKIAFEYNGSQHYDTTEEFPDGEALKEQQAKDAMKIGLSLEAGIHLIIVKPENLRDGAFLKSLPETLAQNWVDVDGPYYQTLLRISAGYAAKTARQLLAGGARGR